MPSCRSEPMPYLPTVKAMAPSTPSGARWMIRPMTLNSTSASASATVATGWPRSPPTHPPQPKNSPHTHNHTPPRRPPPRAPRPPASPQKGEPTAEQHREQQHLQHIAGGKGADRRGRDQFHQELDRAAARELVGVRGVG